MILDHWPITKCRARSIAPDASWALKFGLIRGRVHLSIQPESVGRMRVVFLFASMLAISSRASASLFKETTALVLNGLHTNPAMSKEVPPVQVKRFMGTLAELLSTSLAYQSTASAEEAKVIAHATCDSMLSSAETQKDLLVSFIGQDSFEKLLETIEELEPATVDEIMRGVLSRGTNKAADENKALLESMSKLLKVAPESIVRLAWPFFVDHLVEMEAYVQSISLEDLVTMPLTVAIATPLFRELPEGIREIAEGLLKEGEIEKAVKGVVEDKRSAYDALNAILESLFDKLYKHHEAEPGVVNELALTEIGVVDHLKMSQAMLPQVTRLFKKTSKGKPLNIFELLNILGGLEKLFVDPQTASIIARMSKSRAGAASSFDMENLQRVLRDIGTSVRNQPSETSESHDLTDQTSGVSDARLPTSESPEKKHPAAQGKLRAQVLDQNPTAELSSSLRDLGQYSQEIEVV